MAKVAEGAKLFDASDFPGAISRYDEAYAIFPSPKILYNKAFAYRRMAREAQAYAHFERFLRDSRDAAPEYVTQARAELRILSAKVAFLEVASDAEGAEVLLDGAAVGSTPLARMPMDAGRHEVVVRARDGGSRTRTFTAVAGKALEVRVDFRAAGSVAPRAGPSASAPERTAERPPSEQGFVPDLARSGPSRAEALIREATDLRRVGKDARAYPLLLKACEVETTPRTAAQLGLVEMQLGYWLESERHLKEALSAVRDPWIASNQESLQQSLTTARAAIGEIVVTGTPHGAEVVVNGKPAGRLPLSAPLRAGHGPVNIEVRAAGHASTFRSLTVSGGRREDVAVTLTPNAGLLAEGAESNHAPVRAAPSDSGAREDVRPGGALATLAPPVAWTFAALSAGALAFAAYETAGWRKALREFNGHVSAPAAGQPSRRDCGSDDADRGGPACKEIYSRMERSRNLAFAGYAVGGLFAAGAAAFFVIKARAAGGEADLGVACGPALASRGVSCAVSF
jgi:tetratricopeptide (TPR) repeat protein